MLVHAHNRSINHLHGRIMSSCQRIHDPVPDTSPAPANEVKPLHVLQGTGIYPHILVLLSTGMRRGELMGLQWGDGDLHKGKIRIERAIELTKARGNRIKAPKTRRDRRVISLPPVAVEVLREQRKA